jgi:hypothetical protein
MPKLLQHPCCSPKAAAGTAQRCAIFCVCQQHHHAAIALSIALTLAALCGNMSHHLMLCGAMCQGLPAVAWR